MAFTTNYKADLIPEGIYDAIINSVAPAVTSGGTAYISVSLILSNGRMTTYPIWRAKNPTPADISVDGYMHRTVMAISKAAQLPENTEYASLEAWAASLVGRQIAVNITHEEYNGEPRDRVSYVFRAQGIDMKPILDQYRQRAAASAAQPAPAPAPANVPAGFQPIDDDELPF